MFKIGLRACGPLKLLIQVLLILQLANSIVLDYFTFCIGSCYSCPASPYQCTYVQSLLYPPANYNCLPYTTGDTCTDNAFGYQAISQDGLSGWTGAQTTGASTECTLYHQPASVPKFKIIGPFTGGSNIIKTITINRDTIEQIIIKMSFTINQSSTFFNTTSNQQNVTTTNPNNNNNNNIQQQQPNINPDGTIDPVTSQTTVNSSSTNKVVNRTGRAFVDIAVSGTGFSYLLELNYPNLPTDRTKIVNSTCGINVQYVSSFALKNSIPANNLAIKFNITSYGDNSSTWGISKFQVNVGCGGLMIANGTELCGTCMAGFYPIMAQEGILMGCAPCKPNCKTCTQDRCTLCQSNSYLNPSTSSCQLSSTYINIPDYKITQGIALANLTSQNYIYNIIISQITTNSITIQSQLKSASPFSIKFYILFTKQFPQLLKGRAVQIIQNAQIIMTLSAQQFRTQMGLYDQRLSAGAVRYYLKTVYIDKLHQQNLNKLLEIIVRAPIDAGSFYVSNYAVTQYLCTARCQTCNIATNQCLQCSNFFVRTGTVSCINCPNGFYLKRTYDKNSSTSIVRVQQDVCVKCHSTCKQCVGAQPSQCIQCFRLFYLDSIGYNRPCVKCLFDAKQNPAASIPEQCLRCMDTFNSQSIFLKSSCSLCIKDKKIDDVFSGQTCTQCWLMSGLAYGRCLPAPESGLTFYGADASNGVIDNSSWSQTNSPGPIQSLTCTKDYPDLWGVPNSNNQNNVTLRWVTSKLLSHKGLHIIFNIFKTYFTKTGINTDGTRKYQSLYIKIGDQTTKIELINRKDGNLITPGANLCANDNNNQIIQTFSYDTPTHRQQSITVQVISEGGGIYIRQLQLYLGNCPDCLKNQLNYNVDYLPRYTYNTSTITGIDIWIAFNQPVQAADNQTLKSAFKFSINQLPLLKLQPLQFVNDLALNNRLKYFIPLDQSFGNSTLTIKTNPNAKIYGVGNKQLQVSRRLLINSPLNILSSQRIIHRYSKLSQDDLISTSQIYQFFNFFQWFALITMIVCAFLGIGVVFQEFSILLQLLFLHVYISSAVLPATFKAPLDGLQRMENLNYFADPHAQSIEWQWFKDYIHPSPYVFQQYNKDILFQRSFYPTIIINLMYLVWFIILFVIYKTNQKCQRSQNPVLSFFRHIPARPLNFIDQIWRYQFITTMWSAFMQFHILKNDTAWQRLNLALCFISFIVSILWPLFVVLYTYRLNMYKYTTDFMYKYQDIYYLKFQTISQFKVKYYHYILLRFARYLIMALFISLFTQHEIIAPVILICANVIQIVYVVALKIYYNSALGTVFKVLQNLLFIGVEVALLFAYALSDTAADGDFLNLGYSINVLYVIMIIVGILRVAYLLYRKCKNLQYKKKMGMDNGEVVKIDPMPLPNTERGGLGQQPNNMI